MSEGTGSRSRGQIALASGAAVGTCAAAYLLYRHIVSRSNGFGSTTASSGGGPARYEQMTAVEEYLQMHFAAADDIFPYENAPKVCVSQYADAVHSAPLAHTCVCTCGNAGRPSTRASGLALV